MELPTELWFEISKYLSFESVIKLSCISRNFNIFDLTVDEMIICRDKIEDLCTNCDSFHTFDGTGYSDLRIIAAQNGYLRIIKMLYHVYDLNLLEIISWNCKTTFDYAFENEYIDIMKFIMSKVKINEENKYLCSAVKHQQKEIIQFFLDHGSDINARDDSGKTALCVVCELTDLSMCQFLVDRGADPHSKDNEGNDIIMYALKNTNQENRFEIIQFLLSIGASLNKGANQDGEFPLLIAC